jgi:hypothetical protein
MNMAFKRMSVFPLLLVYFLIILQVLGIVCDNASNNDTMINQLGLLLPGFKGRPARVRCFAHILNLVVKVCNVLI